MKRRAIKTGEERDVHEWRRYLVWHRGEVRAVKRRTNRRERREARRDQREFGLPRRGLVRLVDVPPVPVPYLVDAEHPPADYDG